MPFLSGKLRRTIWPCLAEWKGEYWGICVTFYLILKIKDAGQLQILWFRVVKKDQPSIGMRSSTRKCWFYRFLEWILNNLLHHDWQENIISQSVILAKRKNNKVRHGVSWSSMLTPPIRTITGLTSIFPISYFYIKDTKLDEELLFNKDWFIKLSIAEISMKSKLILDLI
jgi:hypothetical protein